MIMTGKDRGKTGVITRFFPKTNGVIIDGINKRIRHVKGKRGEAGERIEFFAPMNISNIAVVDPKTNKPSRIGYRIESGQKVRFFKKSGEVLPKGGAKKIVKSKAKK